MRYFTFFFVSDYTSERGRLENEVTKHMHLVLIYSFLGQSIPFIFSVDSILKHTEVFPMQVHSLL